MKTIKMGDVSRRARGKPLKAGETYEVSDRDAAALINMRAAKLVKDHGPDETPDSKRRKAAKSKKATSKGKGKKADTAEKPEAESNPAADGGKTEAEGGLPLEGGGKSE